MNESVIIFGPPIVAVALMSLVLLITIFYIRASREARMYVFKAFAWITSAFILAIILLSIWRVGLLILVIAIFVAAGLVQRFFPDALRPQLTSDECENPILLPSNPRQTLQWVCTSEHFHCAIPLLRIVLLAWRQCVAGGFTVLPNRFRIGTFPNQ